MANFQVVSDRIAFIAGMVAVVAAELHHGSKEANLDRFFQYGVTMWELQESFKSRVLEDRLDIYEGLDVNRAAELIVKLLVTPR